RVHVTLTGLPSTALDSTAASMPKSGLDLRPKPPPSKVTCTVTSSADMPSRLATRSRAAWGDWKHPQTSHLPLVMRAAAAGGSIVACARCGTEYSAVRRFAAPAEAVSTLPALRTTLAGLRAHSSG